MTYFPSSAIVANTLRTAGKEAVNDSGAEITKATPVRITSTGVAPIDVSDEDQVSAIAGLAKSTMGDSTSGEIVSAGIIEDVATSIPVGSIVYCGKTPGSLTAIKPGIGVNGFEAGDWVIRLGVMAKNIDNGSNTDMLVNIQIIGQL